MSDQQPGGDPSREPSPEPGREPGPRQDPGAGEPRADAGAAQPDYGMILGMIKEVQANQAAIMGKLKSLSDAQSILVDSGAVVREEGDSDGRARAGLSNDGFIPLDGMDLSI